MRQLRFDQGKDDENDGDACYEILVDQFFAVATIFEPAMAT